MPQAQNLPPSASALRHLTLSLGSPQPPGVILGAAMGEIDLVGQVRWLLTSGRCKDNLLHSALPDFQDHCLI